MSKQKVALITGVTGQDGAYLSELLLNTQYKVYGLVRRSSTPNRDNISHFIDHANFIPFYGDLSDTNSLLSMLRDTQPDEIYNLGAQSDVGISFNIPVSTGEVQETPQTETTPFHPRSPYGVSKLYAYWAVKNYRESYGMFGCNGILFNHESPLRGENFVTRKITKAVAQMYIQKRKDPIELGNMEAKRDWGHAKDYVKGMWQMMQQNESDDYILATGETHSIRELVETAFKYIGETVLWGGTKKNEEGYSSRGDLIVKVNPDFYRPAEVDILCGDPSKAEKKFGWERLHTFENLISEMVEEDINALSKNK